MCFIKKKCFLTKIKYFIVVWLICNNSLKLCYVLIILHPIIRKRVTLLPNVLNSNLITSYYHVLVLRFIPGRAGSTTSSKNAVRIKITIHLTETLLAKIRVLRKMLENLSFLLYSIKIEPWSYLKTSNQNVNSTKKIRRMEYYGKTANGGF